MRGRFALLWLAALAACSSQADKQLEAVKAARSTLSEWALVEAQAAKGRAQSTYIEQMRELAKDQLKTAEAGLAQQPDAASLLDKVRSGTPDAAALKRAGDALKPLEDSLEAA
jgi:hypothetical protein